MLYQELINKAEHILIDANIDKNIAKGDIIDIMSHITGLSKAELIVKKKDEVSAINVDRFLKAIKDRSNHKPLQYITNNALFFGYNFFVNEDCLIPRIDSEVLVETAISMIKDKNLLINCDFIDRKIKVLDACCGSGCLGLSFIKSIIEKKIIKDCNYELSLLDKSSLAIQVAKINAQKLDIKSKFIITDILSYGFGDENYDIIFCNPPYIETDVIKYLDDEVKCYEPNIALDGGEDGLKFYKNLSNKVDNSLTKNGFAVFEIGFNQGEAVKNIFKKENINIKLIKDYGNKDRCVIISKK